MTYPDELIADFQQYYGLNLTTMGLDGDEVTRDVAYAATLAAQLPAASRLAKAQNASNKWTTGEYFLRLIEYELRVLLWGMSDPKRRGDKPSPIMSPAELVEKQELIEHAEAVESAVAAAFDL